jgi:hypothetical protein
MLPMNTDLALAARRSAYWKAQMEKHRIAQEKFRVALGDDGCVLLDAADATYKVWNSSKENMRDRVLHIAKRNAHEALVAYMVARRLKFPA